MRGPSNALGQVESSDAHDGHVTRLVSLRSAGLCKCLGSESGRVALGDWAHTRVKALFHNPVLFRCLQN